MTAAGRTLTSDNAVEELLNRPYLELDAAGQDAFFEAAARAIFDAATEPLASPVSFVEGFERAAREGRFLVASFHAAGRAQAEGSRVLGGLTGDDGTTPHVDIGVNDATASKMSFYSALPSHSRVHFVRGRPSAALGTHDLESDDLAERGRESCPLSVTGAGDEVTEPGAQTVLIRIYGPHGGSISDLMIDGRRAGFRRGDRQAGAVGR